MSWRCCRSTTTSSLHCQVRAESSVCWGGEGQACAAWSMRCLFGPTGQLGKWSTEMASAGGRDCVVVWGVRRDAPHACHTSSLLPCCIMLTCCFMLSGCRAVCLQLSCVAAQPCVSCIWSTTGWPHPCWTSHTPQLLSHCRCDLAHGLQRGIGLWVAGQASVASRHMHKAVPNGPAHGPFSRG